MFFVFPASVGPVSSGISGGYYDSHYGVTAVNKTSKKKRLSTVEQYEELPSSIWEYLECWSTGTWVGYYGKDIQKDGGNNHRHQRHMVLEVCKR